MAMKRSIAFLCIFLSLHILAGCIPEAGDTPVDASKHGVSPTNSGHQNSLRLQEMIDELSVDGGVIYIPAGVYEFAENGKQTIGSHCIKMRSNVSIVGDGEKTVLMPVGTSSYGLDMFYFNDYLDTGEAVYLENCRFENFVIDGSGTNCETYTSAGKGFMFNLFRNCHWDGVTVCNTDATGFGVDCPIDSTIINCIAFNCGKAATADDTGASGFGIGFGYCEEEGLRITCCHAEGNKKFGFFFEHQGRFASDRYRADTVVGFTVSESSSCGNLFNYGGIAAFGGLYENCTSADAVCAGCYFDGCSDFTVNRCVFRQSREFDILIEGSSVNLVLTGNWSDTNRIFPEQFSDDCVNEENSWNKMR